MEESSVDKITLEILRMAKDIVINEYTDLRADLHNQWVHESDVLWKTKRVEVAYPPIPPYPTEIDIVKRAQILFAFLHNPAVTIPAPVLKNTNAAVGQPTHSIVQSIDTEPETKLQTASPTELKRELISALEVIQTPVVEIAAVKALPEEPSTTGLFPSVLKKIDELKNNWKNT